MSNNDLDLLWQHVDKWAEKTPDAEALVFNDTRLSWATFRDQIDRAAKAFLELGVERGDRIAMVSMGRPEFAICYMAAAKIGAIWLGLSPKFTPDELRYVLGHSQPSVIVTLDRYLDIDLVHAGLTFKQEFPSVLEVLVIGETTEGLPTWDAFVNKERPEFDTALDVRVAEVSPDDEALLMYTSGSTGRPKGVLQTHRAIVKNIEVEIEHFGVYDGGRMLLHFPINHVAADVEIFYGAVYSGATTVFMDQFDPQASLEVIEKEKITMVGQVPVMFLMQFQAPKFSQMDWSHVRQFVWGGSTPPQIMLDVLHGISQQTGARLLTGYGSTELCGFVTYSMPDDDLEMLSKSAGKVVPPFEMRIVDADRKPLPEGEVGEIAVRGPSIMKGYLNNPVASKAVLDDDGWYYTSDLGWMNAEGYLFISGRASEMFKTGGENVFPREVEEILEQHPAVLFAAVIGVKDEMYSEVGHAFIMLKPGQETTEEELRGHCKQRLANFKVPKRFDLRPVLPLLANGKVNKMELKKELTN